MPLGRLITQYSAPRRSWAPGGGADTHAAPQLGTWAASPEAVTVASAGLA